MSEAADVYNREAGREFGVGHYSSNRSGRTTLDLVCPFDGTRFTAYVWSLAGSGKKCPTCGALHGSLGVAYPTFEVHR